MNFFHLNIHKNETNLTWGSISSDNHNSKNTRHELITCAQRRKIMCKSRLELEARIFLMNYWQVLDDFDP